MIYSVDVHTDEWMDNQVCKLFEFTDGTVTLSMFSIL